VSRRVAISSASLALFALAAVFAAVHGTSATFAPPDDLCFASGTATYRIAPGAAQADYRVRIGRDAPKPDLRIQLVDRAELAHFVLVDDFSRAGGAACRNAAWVRTVTVDDSAAAPDVTVNLSANASGADYRIFVHSKRFSQQDAAALLAAMWKAGQRRERAARADLRTDP
jgi:hypothetical protein